MSGATFFLWPLLGFFLLCALLALREAANPARTAADRAQALEDEALPRRHQSPAWKAYDLQQSDAARIVRSGRRRASLFALLAAATLAYILVRR